MVFKKLGEYLKQLPRGGNGVVAVPCSEIFYRRTEIRSVEAAPDARGLVIWHAVQETAREADGECPPARGRPVPIADRVRLSISNGEIRLKDGVTAAAASILSDDMQTTGPAMRYRVVHVRGVEIRSGGPASAKRLLEVAVHQKIRSRFGHCSGDQL